MTEQAAAPERELTALEQRFPGVVTLDERKGYEGHIVQADKLIEFATALRDEMGYDYLSSITAVDYLTDDEEAESFFELVYHMYKSTGGAALVFKIQIPRDNPVVDSLVELYPGADFQEREAWDLMGIKFEGHPDLRRILMWDGFEGFPLRKDWKEPYYEEDAKPFGNRWPGGQVDRKSTRLNSSHSSVSRMPSSA